MSNHYISLITDPSCIRQFIISSVKVSSRPIQLVCTFKISNLNNYVRRRKNKLKCLNYTELLSLPLTNSCQQNYVLSGNMKRVKYFLINILHITQDVFKC